MIRAVRIEYLSNFFKYSNTRLMPEVAINYTVAQNKQMPGFSFKLIVQQKFEMSKSNTRNASEVSV